jgi:Holliday junction resolvase RusA-like endonuclease
VAKQTFKMPYIPEASVNHSHGRGRQGQTYLKPEAAWWGNILRQMVQTWADEEGLTVKAGQEVVVTVHASFPRKAGQRPDATNFSKLAQDSIAAGFGLSVKQDWGFKERTGEVRFDDDEGGWLYYEVEVA